MGVDVEALVSAVYETDSPSRERTKVYKNSREYVGTKKLMWG